MRSKFIILYFIFAIGAVLTANRYVNAMEMSSNISEFVCNGNTTPEEVGCGDIADFNCSTCPIPKRQYGKTVSWNSNGCVNEWECKYQCWLTQDQERCCCNVFASDCCSCTPPPESE